MGIKHATVKAPGQQLLAVTDWNPDHIVDSNLDISPFNFTTSGIGTFGTLAAGAVVPSHRFAIGSTNLSDRIDIYHNNTDAYFRTTDGNFIFQTDEGTNTDTLVVITGKGAGRGQLQIYNQAKNGYVIFNPWQNQALLGGGGSMTEFDIQVDANIPVTFFRNAGAGKTPKVYIYGQSATSGMKKSLQISVESDIDNAVNFDGVRKYHFDGTGISAIADTSVLSLGDSGATSDTDARIALIGYETTANSYFAGLSFHQVASNDEIYDRLAQVSGFVGTTPDDGELHFGTTKDGTLNLSHMVLDEDGNVGIGIATPATSAKLDITSTTGALLLPRMTTAQRDALTAVNGMIIYNTTTNAFNFYENGAWVTKANV